MSRLVTIGEAARELGVSTKTLRRYEERGLLKPIRTMGGQRRYYLSALQDVLASAVSDDDDASPASAPVTARSSPPSPPKREPSVWDEVEEEKASFEALKVRSQRDIFVRSQQEDAERAKRERQVQLETERRESQARAAREAVALDQQRAAKEYQSRVQFELTLAEMRLPLEPREAHGAIRKALLSLLTPARIPVGTPSDRISQLVQDEIQTVVAPFKKVRDICAGALKYAERALSEGDLDFFEKKSLRESVEAELAAQLTPEWTPRRAERLVDSLLEELWPEE